MTPEPRPVLQTSSSSQKKKQTHVRVGVGVLVKDPKHPNKVFAGIRKGSHGAGSLALPGGHLEMFETWDQCARREVKEEMNLNVTETKFVHVTNDMMEEEEKHYVTIFIMATCASNNEKQEPENMEPHKCEGWKSYSWDELKRIERENPAKLFGPLSKLLQDEPKAVLDFLSC